MAETTKIIRMFNIDFNWLGEYIAPPGTYSEASTVEHIQFYKDLGCNTIQTFCKSCNGYFWYDTKRGEIQPGLNRNWLGKLVSLARKEDMKVHGYMGMAWDLKVQKKHPEWSVSHPNACTVCLNSPYVDSLSIQFSEAFQRFELEGMLCDMMCFDGRCRCKYCQTLYWKMFQEKIPEPHLGGTDQMDKFRLTSHQQAWQRIRDAVNSVSPKAKLWLNGFRELHWDLGWPSLTLARQTDWLFYECSDPFGQLWLQSADHNKPLLVTLTGFLPWSNPHDWLENLALGGHFFGYAQPEITGNRILSRYNNDLKAIRKIYHTLAEIESLVAETFYTASIGLVVSETQRKKDHHNWQSQSLHYYSAERTAKCLSDAGLAYHVIVPECVGSLPANLKVVICGESARGAIDNDFIQRIRDAGIRWQWYEDSRPTNLIEIAKTLRKDESIQNYVHNLPDISGPREGNVKPPRLLIRRSHDGRKIVIFAIGLDKGQHVRVRSNWFEGTYIQNQWPARTENTRISNGIINFTTCKTGHIITLYR